MVFFLDTYAMIEIFKKNMNYSSFLQEEFATTLFNLTELYFIFSRDYNEDLARKVFYQFKEGLLDIEDETVFKACRMKLKKKDLSYADCIGYASAQKNSFTFLTGDRDFKGIPGVLIVR